MEERQTSCEVMGLPGAQWKGQNYDPVTAAPGGQEGTGHSASCPLLVADHSTWVQLGLRSKANA